LLLEVMAISVFRPWFFPRALLRLVPRHFNSQDAETD
jgi:hypothetical protein